MKVLSPIKMEFAERFKELKTYKEAFCLRKHFNLTRLQSFLYLKNENLLSK